jgi:hypothetical protein
MKLRGPVPRHPRGGGTWAALMFLLVLVPVSRVFAGGDEPWKEKPYQQWTDADVKRALMDSPWSHPVAVSLSWMAGSAPVQLDPNMPTGGTAAPHGIARADIDADPRAQDSGGSPSPNARFIVRWVSSRTLREAMIRGAIISGKFKEEDARKLLDQPESQYAILVAGTNMTPFDGLKEVQLKDDAWLTLKKTKQKIAATDVQIQRSEDGRNTSAIVFLFPRQSATGQPVIPDDEKTIQFTCKLPAAKIETSFDAAKMVDKQGPDL